MNARKMYVEIYARTNFKKMNDCTKTELISWQRDSKPKTVVVL